jgi:hypothetical protein
MSSGRRCTSQSPNSLGVKLIEQSPLTLDQPIELWWRARVEAMLELWVDNVSGP